ncbi:hypothetical protein MHYP_G00223470 [Metynnis hypsauchen]
MMKLQREVCRKCKQEFNSSSRAVFYLTVSFLELDTSPAGHERSATVKSCAVCFIHGRISAICTVCSTKSDCFKHPLQTGKEKEMT